MLSDSELLKNIVTIARFDSLQQNGKNPVLGVFRGRSLVVISHKTDGVLEKLCQFIKGLACCALGQLGFLSTNLSSIKPLKDRVNVYHYKQVEKNINSELSALLNAHTKMKQIFSQEISNLTNERDSLACEKETLSTDLKELSCEKKQLQQAFNGIADDFAIAKDVLHQKQEVEKNLVNLKKQQNLLETDVKNLKDDKNRLLPLKTELERSRSELSRVKADTHQSDFKQQVKNLQHVKNQLENENHRLKKEVNSIRTLCSKCHFPTRW